MRTQFKTSSFSIVFVFLCLVDNYGFIKINKYVKLFAMSRELEPG